MSTVTAAVTTDDVCEQRVWFLGHPLRHVWSAIDSSGHTTTSTLHLLQVVLQCGG